jgi:hypothetical protein
MVSLVACRFQRRALQAQPYTLKRTDAPTIPIRVRRMDPGQSQLPRLQATVPTSNASGGGHTLLGGITAL